MIDSSITLAWIYADEITLNGALVPSLWRLEVANLLEMRVRRGRNSAEFRDPR